MISLFFGGTVFGDMLIDTHTHIYIIYVYMNIQVYGCFLQWGDANSWKVYNGKSF